MSSPPLEGLRVVDVSTYVAGPSGGMTLAQLGADVIRIDPIGGAPDTLRLPRDPHGRSLYWAGLNKGKRSVEIDLRTVEGRNLVIDLLEAPGSSLGSSSTGGILLTNATERWMSYEVLSAKRADIIVMHITGRSDGGPAVDYTVNCETGLPYLTGPDDSDRLVNHVLPAWDLLTGLHAAIGLLAAERVRSRTGRGQEVSVALGDVAVTTLAHLGYIADVTVNHSRRKREGNFVYGSFGCDFGTADGRRIMVVALTNSHWKKLVAMTGSEEAVSAFAATHAVDLSEEENRYRHRVALASLMAPWFAVRNLDDVKGALDHSRVLWGPYRSVEELVRDRDSIMNRGGLFTDVDHPGTGVYPTPVSVLGFSQWQRLPPGRAPSLGEHTDIVLSEILGLDHAALNALHLRNVIGGGCMEGQATDRITDGAGE